jgi:hypothetical protein
MTKLNVVIFGALGGFGDEKLAEFREEIKKLDGVDPRGVLGPIAWSGWRGVLDGLRNFKEPIIPIGYSYGATSALAVARYLGKPVPQVITIDPSQFWRMSPGLWRSGGNYIGPGVIHALNLYQTNSMIGGQRLTRDDGSKKRVMNVLIPNATHTTIIYDTKVRGEIVGVINQAAKEIEARGDTK